MLFEKLPFLALCVASSIVTICAQDKGGAIVPIEHLSWDWRIENCLVSYTTYLGKMFWPANLAIFYPYTQIPSWEVALSVLLLIALSAGCLRRMRTQPYLLTGWCWFVVMLVPVIGLVQVGQQAIADRYTYLPYIGLFIVVAWGMAGVASASRFWRATMILGAAALILACLVDTRIQLRYWRNGVTLFRHTIDTTGEKNLMGDLLLGNALLESDDLEGAARSYQSAVRISPDFEGARYQLGFVLLLQKKWAEAEAQFDEVLRLNPHNDKAHECLGDVFAGREQFAEAAAEYATALQSNPDDVAIRRALARVTKQADAKKNLTQLYADIQIQPTPEAHAQIAALLTLQGKFQEAVDHCQEALRLRPDSPEILNNLAWLLATCPDARIRNGAQAVTYAERACELTHYNVTPVVGTLAAAYAGAGRFDKAVATAEKACALAEKSGDTHLLQRNQDLLALYRRHEPYSEAAAKPAPAAP